MDSVWMQKYLRSEDVCLFVVEVSSVDGTGKRFPTHLALVTHGPGGEAALFQINPRPDGCTVTNIIPIFSDTRVKGIDEHTFELSYEISVFIYDAPSSNVLSSILQELFKAQKIAQQKNFKSSGTSHSFINFYLKQGDLLDTNSSLVYTRTTPSRSGASNQAVASAMHSNSDLGLRGGSEYDPVKFKQLNDSWVNMQLKAREAEFTCLQNLTVFLGTWNVNGKRPGESLEPWLRDTVLTPDIYAIGFQELDLTAEALFLGDTTRAAPWEQHILATLQLQGDYMRLMSKQLVGILLCVYVRKEHMPYVRDVQSGLAAVGIMGMMGNKGGVAIRFQIYDSTVCIVNSHLNAHFENVQRRNQDMRDISRRIMFSPDEHGNPVTIFDSDMLFWIGDLNYRIIGNDADIKERISKQDWAPLLANDQLNQQMKQGLAFDGFSEPAIDFAPSYKYDIGTQTYDTSEKRRSPAWCDRVLYKTAKFTADNLAILAYRRHELLSSDHRPVSATFLLKVLSVVPDKRSKVYQEIVKELDKKENESIPDAAVSSNSVTFKDVRYMVPQTQSIIIENTGQVVAKFRFIPKNDERKFCRPWLRVNPPYGMLGPGTKLDIHLTVHVEGATATDLNMSTEKVEDILILHLENGKDYFITVQGNYLVSSFACSLDHLVRFPHPIRTSTPIPTTDTKLSIPKELWRIIDFIFKKGLGEEGLFLESGVQGEMEIIRECLDTGNSFAAQPLSVHSMAETAIRFLEALAEPLIPYALYDQALTSSSSYLQCKQLLSYLPTVNYNVFYYLISFLREVLSYPDNRLTPDQLAVVFSSVLLRPKSEPDTLDEATIKKKADFVYHFLIDNEDLKVG